MGGLDRREWPCALLAAGVAFAVFYALGGRYDFLFAGHDHWITGHALLLSETHLRTGFGTPWLLPMEDARGPVGAWAPYTGWPPLHFVVLAAFRAVFGSSLATARLLFCAMHAVSVALVGLMAARATRDRLLVLFAILAYVSVPAIFKYCAFGFTDTPALALSLLLVLLYPRYATTGSRLHGLAYILLVVVAGLTSWQCYVVPVACAAARLLDRRATPVPLRRLAAPIAVAAVTGFALLALYGRAEAAFEPNGWVHHVTLRDKLLYRTGWGNPAGAVRIALEHARIVAISALPVALTALTFVLLSRLLGGRGAASEATGDPAARGAGDLRLGRFYALATGLLAALWFVFMPQMHSHDFEAIFAAPPIALAGTLAVERALRGGGAPSRPWSATRRRAVLAAASLLLPVPALVVVPDRTDSTLFASLARDVRTLSDPDTVIVTSFDDRGLWWRLERPVISLRRLERARGAKHLVIIPLVGSTPPSWSIAGAPLHDHAEIVRREGFPSRARGWMNGYAILAPRDLTSEPPSPAPPR